MRALVVGTFDLFHYGHERLLARARVLADEVIVGVNSDRYVCESKGRLPVRSEEQRIDDVTSAGWTAVLNLGPARDLIERLHPNLLVVGYDWHGTYPEHIGMTVDDLAERGVTLCYMPRTPGISTTDLR